jgi:hypothetical protein
MSFVIITSGRTQTVKTRLLNNTKWVSKVVEGCINIYHFRTKGNYIYYSCEQEDTSYGKFYFRGDTLILDERSCAHDSDERIERSMYKLIIKSDTIRYISRYDWRVNHFQKSDFEFDKETFFTKVK